MRMPQKIRRKLNSVNSAVDGILSLQKLHCVKPTTSKLYTGTRAL